jgi:hypothetical protein
LPSQCKNQQENNPLIVKKKEAVHPVLGEKIHPNYGEVYSISHAGEGAILSGPQQTRTLTTRSFI